MATIKDRIRPRRRPTHYLVERVALLDRFDKLRAAGLLALDAAADINLPLSTIFRWKAAAKESYLRSREKDTQAVLTHSLAILYESEQHREVDVLEALFIFTGWLRCSTKPQMLDLSVATLLIAVAKARFNVSTLAELPGDFRDAILRHIRLSDFLSFCAITPFEETVDFPTFWDDLLDDQPYDDRDELARMCWCLLALSDSREYGPASLNKTMYLMGAGVFRYTWKVSRRTRDKFWQTHAPAAPFFYVERFHSPLDLSLRPQEPDFLLKVDELLGSPKAIKDFLRKAFGTISQLAAAMDHRALQIAFPQFPQGIAPLEMRKPTLTPSIVAALDSFRSSGKL